MSLADRTLHLCSCNGTMPLDAEALARALELPARPPCERCSARRNSRRSPATRRATSSSRARRRRGSSATSRRRAARAQTIRFVNIRETGGWSAEARARDAEDRRAARARGAARARARAARRVPLRRPPADRRPGGGGAPLGARRCPPHLGVTRPRHRPRDRRRASGGARTSRCIREGSRRSPAGSARSTSPGRSRTRSTSISARAATRASRACPEQAIDFTYQIDLDRCKAHRKCVAACGATAAIDFARQRRRAQRALRPRARSAARRRTSRMHQPPQGYLAPGRDAAAQAAAAMRNRADDRRIREAEVLRVQGVDLRAQPLAARPGCNQCIDVCSTAAIAADGDHVKVEPHLCMGCGACATVCPSGAMSYAYPSVPDLGRARAHAARDVRQGGRPRRLPPAARRGRARGDRARSRGAVAGCRRGSFRSKCITSPRSGSTSGSRRLRTARRRSRCS